jgi:hypothetical protein
MHALGFMESTQSNKKVEGSGARFDMTDISGGNVIEHASETPEHMVDVSGYEGIKTVVEGQ